MADADKDLKAISKFFLVAALTVLFIYSTLELYTYLNIRFPNGNFKHGGVSILWSIFAISFVLLGILKASGGLRYGGLALFAVIIGKVMLLDLSKLNTLSRIIAFIVVGIVIMLCAVIYVRFKDVFEIKPVESRKEG